MATWNTVLSIVGMVFGVVVVLSGFVLVAYLSHVSPLAAGAVGVSGVIALATTFIGKLRIRTENDKPEERAEGKQRKTNKRIRK